jgi:hypothetical protein
VQTLIIVARDQPDLWQSLKEHFAANEEIEPILDRRRWERRQRIQGCEPDRRGPDRRHPLGIEHDLRARQFVIVRPKPERLEA